jgi:hypothetical protein
MVPLYYSLDEEGCAASPSPSSAVLPGKKV